MFKRKADVDKHVASILSRKKSDKERSTLGFQIARMYNEIKEFSTAKMYLSGYLTVQEVVPQAHELMGEINEGLGLKEYAVKSYRRALDLSGSVAAQEHLLKKICDLYKELGLDEETFKYCIEKYESLMPNSDLLEKIEKNLKVSSEEKLDISELTDYNQSPLEEAKYHFLSQHKMFFKADNLKEAFITAIEHAFHPVLSCSLDWLESALKVFEEYFASYPDCKQNSQYYVYLLHLLRNLTLYSIRCKDLSYNSLCLWRFDQELKNCYSLPITEQLWTLILTEMKGQECLLSGLIFSKMMHMEIMSWEEIKQCAGLCLTMCYYVPPLKVQNLPSIPEVFEKCYHYWHLHSYDRLSHAGHVIVQLSNHDLVSWNKTMSQARTNKINILKQLYSCFDDVKLEETFLFDSIDELAEISLDHGCFTEKQMLEYDKVAVRLHLNSLPHLVWLCLQHYSIYMSAQPNYDFLPLECASFATQYLPFASEAILSNLDMLVFLLAAVRCAASVRWNISSYSLLLPVTIVSPLCTQEQEEWWAAACKFCTDIEQNEDHVLSPQLKQGIETVRLNDAHGLSAMMTAHLARTIDAKVKGVIETGLGSLTTSDLMALEKLSTTLWQQTYLALQDVDRNQFQLTRLFKEVGDENIPVELLAKIAEETNCTLTMKARNNLPVNSIIHISTKLSSNRIQSCISLTEELLKSYSPSDSLLVKMLMERNQKLTQQNQMLLKEFYQMRKEQIEKDFEIQKLKFDVMSVKLLHTFNTTSD